MSKFVMIVLVGIALVLGGYYYTRPSIAPTVQQDTITVQDQMVKTESATSQQSSRYIPFTPAVLAKASTARRILYFYANWCSTCRPANADFEKNASMLPGDLTVIRVNYNDPDTDAEEKALAAKYGITYQHTFVQIDERDEVVTTWNGGATKELLAKIK